MEDLITIIRFPVGIIGIVIISVVLLLVFPFEFICAVFYFPYAAIALSRKEFRESWIGSFPNSIWGIRATVDGIWEWIVDD